MLELFCKKILKKKRYLLIQDELCWEIDVFEGKLEGLILAEIELPAVDTLFSLPDWIEEEVTEDSQYLNANLIEQC
jgi:adenylate cyclase